MKKKLTAAQRSARKKRKAEFMTVFMNGRQVCVRHWYYTASYHQGFRH